VETLPEFLDRVADAGDHGIVLHREGAPLRSVLPRPGSAITLLVGPEGGLTPDELSGCLAAGFEPGRLGGTVLRFETAGLAAVALIAQEGEADARVPDEDRGGEA
jgi:16S rRNA (uracil1498-N3)-methyltransferase